MGRKITDGSGTDSVLGNVLGPPADGSTNLVFSVSVWAAITGGSGRHLLGNGASGTGWGLYNNAGAMSLFLAGIGFVTATTLTYSTNGTWHHYVYVITPSATNSTVSYFKDGTADSSNPKSVGASGVGGPTTSFGLNTQADSEGGTYADLAVYPYALTQTEINALAQGIRPPAIARQKLQIYWPLDGIQSPEPDLSGNANNGTLNATTKGFGPPVTMFLPRWPMTTPVPPSAVTPIAVAGWAEVEW